MKFAASVLIGGFIFASLGTPGDLPPGSPADRPHKSSHEARAGSALQPLPSRLQVQVKLAIRITANLAVGSLIRGVVASAVRKNGSVLIAAGSPVLGRIRRLERNAEAGYFVVAFEFTEVQSQGIRYRFSGDLLGFDAGYGLERNLSSYSERIYAMGGLGGSIERSKWETTTLPDLRGAAAFFFSGEKLDLPPGFSTLWKTSPAKP